ncbi:MAG: radical SAM protein [Alphaproteobacteria bacterium]|nr:radical SAM protein [Alphaproteobacteria bacterium]MBT7942770.1 radical SAM protein [Alphaproteobacteria bacterium]
MIEAIRAEAPDVVALSFYVWNTQINSLVMRLAKQQNPQCLTIGGGPIFTDLNANSETATSFFGEHSCCDAFVLNQGELPFLGVLRRFLEVGAEPEKFRAQPVPGTLVNGGEGVSHVSAPMAVLDDLNDIPSPYLNGLMDPFFDDVFTPQIETNRSCPYRCTFCAWGIGTKKLLRFDEDRILAEIDYIADRSARVADLIICDANFGILPRDVEIATHIAKAHHRTGYPGHVSAQWSKAKPERVIEVAAAMEGLSEVTASLQTTNKQSLEAIKRRNLPLDRVTKLAEELFLAEGTQVNVFSELILGLPEETRESHLEANRYLMDKGIESVNYNLHLLPGTEMDTRDNRENYFHKTVWRMHDGCYGIYDGIKVIESQEVVAETSTMSMEDLHAFRFTHFLIQMMWGRRHFLDFLLLLRAYNLHPLDSILAVDTACRQDTGEIGELFTRFVKDHALEAFETREELFEYWKQDAPFERLRSGKYGKLNYQYTFEVLIDHFEAFCTLLNQVGRDLLKEAGAPADVRRQCEEILRFTAALRLQIDDDFQLVRSKTESFHYDFLSWRKQGYKEFPPTWARPSEISYDFRLGKKQKLNLESKLDQFRSADLTTTLRTMSVYMSPDDLFYKVEPLSAGNVGK